MVTLKPTTPLLAPRQGSLETGIASAPENCTKNTHFAPAKAMTVSTDPPHRPAKATPVSVEARSAPAKAMTVSTPYRYQQAKATPVSDRPSWPTGSGCGGRGRRRGLAAVPTGSNNTTATQISHVIYRAHFSRHPKNVAIPTMQIRYLNKPQGNYVRN